MHAYPHLLADVGGTNIRLGVVDAAGLPLRALSRLATPASGDIADAIAVHLATLAPIGPASAAIALAAPITRTRIQLTNSGAHIDHARARARLGLGTLVFVNDLAATAASLPHLAAHRMRMIGRGAMAMAPATRLVIGCGTGCGVSASIPVGERCQVVPSEAGHMAFRAVGADEERFQRFLSPLVPSADRGVATYDRVLCGSGLLAMAECFAREHGAAPLPDPETVAGAAVTGTDSHAGDAAALFARILGSFAGELALAFLPFGGVYLAGAILERLAPVLLQGEMRARFCDKGRQSALLAEIPIGVIMEPLAPLLGLAAILAEA